MLIKRAPDCLTSNFKILGSDELSTECKADALPPSHHGWTLQFFIGLSLFSLNKKAETSGRASDFYFDHNVLFSDDNF